jgi:predicted O-methyltransferase YrrM
MKFDDPKVQTAFDRYEARAAEDAVRMKTLGPGGFALRDEFLLPVGAEAGRFLHALILGSRPKRILELGTSYGYSTLILADAARSAGAEVVTMDLADYKQAFARDMLEQAGLTGQVEFRCGDAIAMIAADPGTFDFVLLDIWKELYIPCLDAVLPKLTTGGIIAADNMLSPEIERPKADAYRASVASRPELSSVLLDLGQGIELSVRRRD